MQPESAALPRRTLPRRTLVRAAAFGSAQRTRCYCSPERGALARELTRM